MVFQVQLANNRYMIGYQTVDIKGPYADHILIPQGSTGSSIFVDIK